MKTINKKELITLNNVIDFIESYTDYYYDVDDPESDVVKMRNALPILKGIIQKKDFKKKVVEKVKVVEKKVEIINENKIKDMMSIVERHARECVDPLFKYCVFISTMKGILYVTDDYAKALDKAKTLSYLTDRFVDICTIKKISDESYKLFKECFYWNGEYVEEYNDKEFLHFDYIRNLFQKIEKL